jgi:predicted component of type VI protein secretion system
MVAILAAPDFAGGGAVFPVRAGKNVIGADRGSDVVLINDPEVSLEHAIILHRQGAFHLSDRLSSNGTWVNDRELPASGTVLLTDRDRIRCGKTEFVFLVIEPGQSAPAEPVAS